MTGLAPSQSRPHHRVIAACPAAVAPPVSRRLLSWSSLDHMGFQLVSNHAAATALWAPTAPNRVASKLTVRYWQHVQHIGACAHCFGVSS